MVGIFYFSNNFNYCYMILNIENWQKPDTVKIEYKEVKIELPKQPSTNIIKPYKGWTAPEFRSTTILCFNDKNHPLEGKLYIMEQLKKEYMTAKSLDKYSIGVNYRDIAETYNLMVGFECIETEITK